MRLAVELEHGQASSKTYECYGPNMWAKLKNAMLKISSYNGHLLLSASFRAASLLGKSLRSKAVTDICRPLFQSQRDLYTQ